MQRNPWLLEACLWLVVLAGCGDKQSDNNEHPPSQDEFDQLLAQSVEELQLKTEGHTAWGLGKFEEWELDQDQGRLVFSNPDGTRAVAPAQIIGSFNTLDKSWLWAWDNPSVVDALKRDALKVKSYGEQHNIEKLTSSKWQGEESDAWAMAALAVKLCDAQGAYRGPAGDTLVFISFGKVEISKARAAP
jgi:hypothetical protein